MKIWGSANVLTNLELEKIEKEMIKIYEEVGFKIENTEIVDILSQHGAEVKNSRVYFKEDWIKNFLKESNKDIRDFSNNVSCHAGAYPQFYLPPGSRKPILHTAETCVNMTTLADNLENIDGIYDCMGVPDDIPKKIVS